MSWDEYMTLCWIFGIILPIVTMIIYTVRSYYREVK